MQISQIYFTDSGDALPDYLASCVSTVRSCYPKFGHAIYNLEMARDFINRHFGDDVRKAFDKLVPYAYKADLLRYCLLHEIGGWYFDIASRAFTGVDLSSDIETLAFRDQIVFTNSSWAVSNTVLYAKPNSIVYQKAIELVIQNCRDQYYGIGPLCPTGPYLLGRAFADAGPSQNRFFGSLLALTPSYENKNMAFVFPNGMIAAFAKTIGDLKDLGASGTNSYAELYAKGLIYNPDIKL